MVFNKIVITYYVNFNPKNFLMVHYSGSFLKIEEINESSNCRSTNFRFDRN